MPRLDLAAFARAYDIAPFWDYERAGGGLLIANGTGVMLAAMDEIPTLSWCADVTGLRDGQRLDRWLSFAEIAARSCSHVCATLVCFIDDPGPLVELLDVFDAERLSVYSNRQLHATAQAEWSGFVERATAQGHGSAARTSGVEPFQRERDT